MSLNLPICHACNTTLSRKQRRNITENVTNPPYLGAQLKKCDRIAFIFDHMSFITRCLPKSRTGVEFRFGLRESKLILKFQLLHISMEKLILISGCYENHCENRFSDSRRISSPARSSPFHP